VAAARRLLCVYQHAPTPGAGGFYRHRTYFAELVRRGWSVDLVSTPVHYLTGRVPERYARKPYVRETIDGITHHWVWASSSIHRSRGHRALNYAAFATTSMLRGLALPRPDVVWASSPPLPVAAVGSLLARRFRRRWILEVRDVWPESAAAGGWLSADSRPYRLLDSAARRYTRRADAVVVPSPGMVDGVRAHGATNVHVVPGVVVEHSCDEETRRHVRRELGVDDGTCLFAYVGALGVANGLDTLVDATRGLGDGVAVVVAGDGSDRERLERRLAAETDSPIRLLGPVPQAQAHELLCAADVCLHILRPDPLFRGVLPTKVLDAFATHRPLITTVPGVSAELAQQSGGAYAGSADELRAELLRWAVLDANERRRRGQQAFAYGTAQFGLEPTVDRLEQLLLQLAS
jgi:putative colanic acid biosynthesis glycosyltransferase WcaI